MKLNYKSPLRIWITVDKLAYLGIGACYLYVLYHAARYLK